MDEGGTPGRGREGRGACLGLEGGEETALSPEWKFSGHLPRELVQVTVLLREGPGSWLLAPGSLSPGSLAQRVNIAP